MDAPVRAREFGLAVDGLGSSARNSIRDEGRSKDAVAFKTSVGHPWGGGIALDLDRLGEDLGLWRWASRGSGLPSSQIG